MVKVGNAILPERRVGALNSRRYGGITDWVLLFHAKFDEAGKIEFAAHLNDDRTIMALNPSRIMRTYGHPPPRFSGPIQGGRTQVLSIGQHRLHRLSPKVMSLMGHGLPCRRRSGMDGLPSIAVGYAPRAPLAARPQLPDQHERHRDGR